MLHVVLVLCSLAAAAVCTPERVPDRPPGSSLDAPIHLQELQLPQEGHEVQKRSPGYNFGLGKRAYSYVSEYKRLPVYNFGLGKRSPQYSFGLGKRSLDGDVELNPEEQQLLEELVDKYNLDLDDDVTEEKRGRPYSFGLGKRYPEQDASDQEKRTRMYEFGLGKRTPYYSFGLGKRQVSKAYSFGLGKRLSSGKFNFGLGKRERANRFSFGLGKRSESEMTAEEDNA